MNKPSIIGLYKSSFPMNKAPCNLEFRTTHKKASFMKKPWLPPPNFHFGSLEKLCMITLPTYNLNMQALFLLPIFKISRVLKE